MKRIIEVNADLLAMEDLLGKTITVFCLNYIYTGELVGVNSTFIELANAKIVYETGSLTSSSWKDAQELPHNWFIMKSAIETWGILDKE